MRNLRSVNQVFITFLSVTVLAGTSFSQGSSKKNQAVNHTYSHEAFSPAYIKDALVKSAKWQLKHPKHSITDWTNGAFYAGLFAAYEATQSAEILDSLLAIGERAKWRPGPRYDHADDIAVCQTYIDLYRIKRDPRMIQPTLDTIHKLRTVSGNEIIKHGLTWWWCDALFMAPPTLAKLSATLDDPAFNTFSDLLFKQTYQLLYNQREHLFARDANYLIDAKGAGKKETNGQPIFWSRGNGWVLGGLVRVLNELPPKHPTRSFYIDLYKQMSERIVSLQQPDGLWRASLLDPAAYPGGEASGSGFDCYALAWGINQGILLKETYQPAVEKAWIALTKLMSPEGRVGWVQPIGADPRRNFSEDSWEVYGTGAFLLAGSEMIKLNP
ncbi:hypothetical protein GCM10028806_22410 [Spirosoma terrae]|uniref:Glycoside hydrolase family 88 protein n=1 Tax=Spirosoma terrae TaxID=1968276 RepID=A0A6L9L1M7_9BACT|nr:glycoside hydrolase family 88 protein [Spirosoma terrae]NDU94445.1 glycoside hydrolase family 88 protein [Spirosoma terrae]